MPRLLEELLLDSIGHTCRMISRNGFDTREFCQQNKPSNQLKPGLLPPLESPDYCFQSVSMDFMMA